MTSHKLDLRGVEYPMDYVSAYLLLGRLAPGCRTWLIFDDEDQLTDLVRALQEDGHGAAGVQRWGRDWVVDMRSGQRAPVA